MSKSCQLSVSHINIIRGDENLLATKEKTSTPTLYTYFRNFNDSRRNWYPSFHSNAGNGKTRHDIFAQDGAAFKTFFPKSSTSTSWRHDALHLAMSETWELGTSQINYRTLPGNLPHRSRACLNKIFLGQYIYIHTYIQLYNYTNTHESSKYYINGRKKSWNWSTQPNFFNRFQRRNKNIIDYFFLSFSCL